MSIGLVLITLFIILFGAEAFTNALEHLGARLKISEGVTGSIFAAVGTALPETIRASAKLVVDGHGTEADHPLYLSRIGLPENIVSIVAQLGIGLALIIVGAKGFVHGIEGVSAAIGVSALVLSLLIVPVATELPEKINSILWIRRRRDTLAFGNITGAMVFQGSLLPAIGIMLTPWEPRPEVLLGMGLTLLASSYLFIMLRRGPLRPWHLTLNGLCYLTYFLTLTW